MAASRDLRVLYLARGDDSATTPSSDRNQPGVAVERREALSECLRHVRLDAILTSRDVPAQSMAAPTAEWHGLEVQRVAAFDDIRSGVLERSRPHDPDDPEFRAVERWRANPWRNPLPGVEPTRNFIERVASELRSTVSKHADRTVLVVTHRSAQRVILGLILGWPLEVWFDVSPAPRYLYRFAFDGSLPLIETMTLGGRSTGTTVEGFIV